MFPVAMSAGGSSFGRSTCLRRSEPMDSHFSAFPSLQLPTKTPTDDKSLSQSLTQ